MCSKMKTRFTELRGTVFLACPLSLDKHIADEIGKWAKEIKFAGIKGQ
jgi:hypothetical protein